MFCLWWVTGRIITDMHTNDRFCAHTHTHHSVSIAKLESNIAQQAPALNRNERDNFEEYVLQLPSKRPDNKLVTMSNALNNRPFEASFANNHGRYINNIFRLTWPIYKLMLCHKDHKCLFINT